MLTALKAFINKYIYVYIKKLKFYMFVYYNIFCMMSTNINNKSTTTQKRRHKRQRQESCIETTASIDATSPSEPTSPSDATSPSEPTSPVIVSKKMNHKIFLDWDDTLIATTQIRRFGRDSISLWSDMYSRNKDLAYSHIKTFLKRAFDITNDICIVTNAQDGWIETSLENYVEDTEFKALVKRCKIISARDQNEHLSSSPTVWKLKTFIDELQSFEGTVWSIGDGYFERQAIFGATSSYEFLSDLEERIMVHEQQQLRYLIDQIKSDPLFKQQELPSILVSERNPKIIVKSIKLPPHLRQDLINLKFKEINESLDDYISRDSNIDLEI